MHYPINLKKRPKSCDTFVVLGDLTKDGCIIFGKNSDRPQHEVQEIVYEPAKDHPSDSKLNVSCIKLFRE